MSSIIKVDTIKDTSDNTLLTSSSGNVSISNDLTVDTDTLYVDSTNNRVGVGTTSPSTALTVDGNTTFQDAGGTTLILENSTAASYVGDGTELQGAIHFKNNDTSGDGDHIGAKIESYVSNATGSGNLEFHTGRSATGSDILKRMEIAIDGDISFYEDTGTTAKLYWDANLESLGIGTSSPESTLHVEGTSNLQSPIKIKALSANGNTLISDRYLQNESLMNIGIAFSGGALVLGSLVKPSDSSQSDATGYLSSQDAFSSKRSAIKIDGTNGQIKFLTTNTSATVSVGTAVAMSERMRIDDNGNVGIGTTSPSQALDVSGNLTISGSLSKGSGSFKIDHPLPEKTDTHHLVHSFVEAPQADNIYRGKVDLVNGTATVNIDTVAGMTEGTFILLNREIQCFTSNETGWTAVKGSVSDNILTITAQDNTCTDTISWLVIGERQDQHMYDTEWTDENGKVIVEPLKPVEEETDNIIEEETIE